MNWYFNYIEFGIGAGSETKSFWYVCLMTSSIRIQLICLSHDQFYQDTVDMFVSWPVLSGYSWYVCLMTSSIRIQLIWLSHDQFYQDTVWIDVRAFNVVQVYQYFTIYRWYLLLKFEHISWMSCTCNTLRRYQWPFLMGESTWYHPLLRYLKFACLTFLI